jgi:hypothetical protein
MMPTRRQTLLSALIAAAWQLLPRQARAAEKPYAAFNGAFGAKIAVPFLDKFDAAADALLNAAVAFKAKPAATNFATLMGAFGQFSDAWMAVQLLRFGPLSQDQRLDRIAYWPERRSITDKQMAAFITAADSSKLAPASFATSSVAIQGLSALERLLFDGESTGDGKPVSDKAFGHLSDGTPVAAYRAAFIVAIATNLRQIAKETRKSWTELATKLAKSDQAGLAASPQEATGQIYAALLAEAQIIGDQKIGLALGKSIDAAKPKQAEQWRAGRSLPNISLNLSALRQALIGDPAGSVIALVPAAQASDLKQRLTVALDACDQAAAAISKPLDIAVADATGGRHQVETLLVKVNQLRDILGADLPKAIGITLGFNELDGDGG